MIIDLDSNRLEVGMFIMLPDGLLDNPFWKSKFELKADKQINKIIKAGIKRVKVDTEKSSIEVKVEAALESIEFECEKDEDKTPPIKVSEPERPKIVEPVVPDKWEPEKFMPLELVEAVKDKSMPANERAKVIQNYSTEMMKNILNNPSKENITATKEGIVDIVDIIMNEDETSLNLMKIVSHDFYTYTHSVNVGVKAILLAKAFYGDSGHHDMHELGAGFFLHDIGKVNVSSDIINKQGKLTDEEMATMRKHSDESNKVLSKTEHLTEQAKIIVMQHHERDDGTGYPLGLKGFDIHPYGTICCLADVYDALTGKRSYKMGRPPNVALEIMVKEMSNHFNNEMLKKFLSLFEENKEMNLDETIYAVS